LQKQGDDVLWFDAELFREFFDRGSFNQSHWFQFPGNSWRFQPAGDALFERECRRRRNKLAIETATLAFANSLARSGRPGSRSAAASVRRRNVSGLWR